MRLRATIDIFEYWNRIRGTELAPLRSQIEPREVRHILANLFMLEKTEAGRIVFRLAGTKICDLFGRDLGGCGLSELWAHGQEDIESTAAGIMDHGIPALLNATGYSTAGHRATFEIILLPLRSTEGSNDKLLGAIAPATAASWLEVVPLQFLALDRSRLLHEPLARQLDTLQPPAPAPAARPASISATLQRLMSELLHRPSDGDVPFRHS
jgi:hypothetical protein